jgi:polar amino acid transport system substrate-binding protein
MLKPMCVLKFFPIPLPHQRSLHFFCLIVLLVFGICLVACSPSRDANELVVGMELSYPPFETITPEGTPVGVSVDLAYALGESLGRPVRLENLPFTGLIPSLKTGKIDCIISSMTDTPARRESIAFSDPYLTTGLALLVAKDSPLTGIRDLDQPGNKVSVRQGTTGEVWARANLKHAKVLALEKESSAVQEVIQGHADAFLYDQMSVWQNAQMHPTKTRSLLHPLQAESWAIGLRKGDESLRGAINAFLKEYREQGGFERLGEKYLSDQKAAFEQAGVPFVF